MNHRSVGVIGLAAAVSVAWAAGCGTAASDEGPRSEALAFHHTGHARDAGTAPDAGDALDASTALDATETDPDAALSPAGGPVVSCGNGADPAATCAFPDHCCFTNYSAEHDGYCTREACTYGTVSCDGPEDCASGEVCCAVGLSDPDDGTIGYVAACTSDACATTPLVHELCHAGDPGDPGDAGARGACSDPSTACVAAFGNDNDLPAALGICQ